MKMRSISLLVCALLGYSCFPVNAQPQPDFKDSGFMNTEVASAVQRLKQAGIVEGTPDGRFLPQRSLNRNELAVLVNRLWEKTAQYSNSSGQAKNIGVLMAVFSPSEEKPNTSGVGEPLEVCVWSPRACDIAWEHGLVKGYPDSYYRGRRSASRAEFAAMLTRLTQHRKSPANLDMKRAHFSDMQGDEWYFGPVLIAAGAGGMRGYPDRTFRPHRAVSRGEAAVALAKLLPEASLK